MSVNFLSNNILSGLSKRKNKLRRNTLIFIFSFLFLYLIPFIFTQINGTFYPNSDFQNFVSDINFAFIAIFCIPSILIILINTNDTVNSNLEKLIDNRSLVIKEKNQDVLLFQQETQRYHKWVNGISIIAGLLLASLTIFNTILGTSETWYGHLNDPHKLSFVGGYAAITVIFLYSYLLVQLFFTELRVVKYLKLIVENSELKVLPLHPDRLGGLRPISQIGFSFQMALGIIGVNVGVFLYYIIFMFEMNVYTVFMIVLSLSVYAVASPFAFIAPLYVFRKNISSTKKHLLNEISLKHNALFDNVLKDENNDLIEKLEYYKYLHSEVSELPEWPFDFSTLKKFTSVFLAPIYSIALAFIVEKVIELL